MEFKRLLQNKKGSVSQEHCAKVLGSQTQLIRAADTWKRDKDLFTLIATSEIVDFCTDPDTEYSSKEIKAFQAGLAAIPSFLALAHIEVQELKKKKQEESSGKKKA